MTNTGTTTMLADYITYASARATQADALETAIARISSDVLARQSDGVLEGPGPIFVGIGASLAAAAAPVWSLRQRGIHSWRLGAGDYPLPFPTSVHPVIGISQSGKSTEPLAVLESIDAPLRFAVVNSHPSPVSALANTTISLGNIPDSYASTIGYTATITALGMIADVWDGGTIDAGWVELPELFRSTELMVTQRVDEIASTFRGAQTADFVGAGPSVGSAEAGALLFREVARVHAAALSTRQYLHGSMESAGDGVHVLFGEERELEVARMLAQAGHRAVLISTADVADESNLQVIRIPDAAPSQRAILEALVMQVLVEKVAKLAGVEIEEFVFFHTDTKVEGSA